MKKFIRKLRKIRANKKSQGDSPPEGSPSKGVGFFPKSISTDCLTTRRVEKKAVTPRYLMDMLEENSSDDGTSTVGSNIGGRIQLVTPRSHSSPRAETEVVEEDIQSCDEFKVSDSQ